MLGWRPVKPNSASITLKRYDYVDGNPGDRVGKIHELNSPERQKGTKIKKELGYKAAMKLQDQFDDEKRAGAELTQENDKSQYKKCLDTSS
ncbi:hypothetical protein Tco_0643260 [Tanacetum coccineum]